MKLKGFYQDRKAQPCELDGVTFYVKPLDSSKMSRTRTAQMSKSSDYLPLQEKIAFAKDNVEDWENLFYDNDEQVPFSKENAVELLSKDEYDSLCFALFEFAFGAAIDLQSKTKKDAETAGKS